MGTGRDATQRGRHQSPVDQIRSRGKSRDLDVREARGYRTSISLEAVSATYPLHTDDGFLGFAPGFSSGSSTLNLQQTILSPWPISIPSADGNLTILGFIPVTPGGAYHYIAYSPANGIVVDIPTITTGAYTVCGSALCPPVVTGVSTAISNVCFGADECILADVSGDQIPDLVTIDRTHGTQKLSVHLGAFPAGGVYLTFSNSTTDMPTAAIPFTSGQSLGVGDVNGDGIADIVRFSNNPVTAITGGSGVGASGAGLGGV